MHVRGEEEVAHHDHSPAYGDLQAGDGGVLGHVDSIVTVDRAIACGHRITNLMQGHYVVPPVCKPGTSQARRSRFDPAMTEGKMSEATGEGGQLPTAAIEDYLAELRTFPPSEGFAHAAVVGDRAMFEHADQDLEGFWAEQAGALSWFEPFEQVLDWRPPFAKWFVGGRLNIAFNCLDRHVEAGLGERVAFHFEGEPGDRRTITYADLLEEVGRCANAPRSLGVERGDRVAIYMPMIPELAVAMLACARIGEPTVVFGGFSADALRDRIEDASARVLITADGGWRRGHAVELKRNADHALSGGARSIEHVLVVRRLGDAAQNLVMTEGRDHWWHELVAGQDPHSPPEAMDSEDLLYLLYTIGHNRAPEGDHAHDGGLFDPGRLFTHRTVFDLKAESDVYWCAADIGWVTGHSYIVYGPLANGATSVMYEGTPDFPERDRWWSIIERYKVTTLYTAPDSDPDLYEVGRRVPRPPRLVEPPFARVRSGNRSTPRPGSGTGREIGGGRCPIVDTWWQTETGAIMISPLPGITTLKPGSATFPPCPGSGPRLSTTPG